METTLFDLFLSQKEKLCSELSALKFPQDLGKFESILQKVFIEDVKIDEYKNSLTNQEIAMLNSLLGLINLPEILSKALNKEFKKPECPVYISEKENKNLSRYLDDPIGRNITLGSTIGGLAGACLWNTCKIPGVGFYVGVGSVLCSIIGGVAAYYIISTKNKNPHNLNHKSTVPDVVYSLDVNVLVETIEGICSGVDKCIAVFRDTLSQCEKDIQDSNKKDLVHDYSFLLQSLSDLYIQSEKAESSDLKNAASDVFRSLQNYRIQFKLYSAENQKDFIETESGYVTECITTKPALYKDGSLIEPGESLVPIKNI